MNKMICSVLLLIFAHAAAALGESGAVPNPVVTGPVASPGIPGATAHNYTFFATNHELAVHGYIEEEFFIEGTANRYNTPAQTTGTVIDGNHPYKTRVVVRRPADAKRFNGTVLVEWYNVTNNFDAENMWFFAWEHMMGWCFGAERRHYRAEEVQQRSLRNSGCNTPCNRDRRCALL
jgi:hypothetical protein